MKKVILGTLKKKVYTRWQLFIAMLIRRPPNMNILWIVISNGKEFILVWDKEIKIDDTFDGKEIGFIPDGKFANIVTFYPSNFRKIYPELID